MNLEQSLMTQLMLIFHSGPKASSAVTEKY